MAETTGTDLLRASLRGLSMKCSLNSIAHEAGSSPSALDEFVDGVGRLPVDVLNRLAFILFDATYDPGLDRLRPSRQEVKSTPLGVGPPPFDPAAPRATGLGGMPVAPRAASKRPGWA